MNHHSDDLALAARCLAGEVSSWDTLVARLRSPVYSLAIRLLYSPEDAEDVTQEVLLKVVTALHSYRGEATLTTWAYRIASRHLVDIARRPAEALTFDEGREHLLDGLREPAWTGPDAALLATEVKIACSTSMLVCLSRPLRLSYIVGAVLDLAGPEAAWILDVDPATHRKRLSLARAKIRDFLAGVCGLYDPANPCRCARQITYDVRIGRIDAHRPGFVGRAAHRESLVLVDQIHALEDDLAIMRSNPDLDPQRDLMGWLLARVASSDPPFD